MNTNQFEYGQIVRVKATGEKVKVIIRDALNPTAKIKVFGNYYCREVNDDKAEINKIDKNYSFDELEAI